MTSGVSGLSQSVLHSVADAPSGSNEGPLQGLSSEQAQQRLLEHGRNEIPENVPWLASAWVFRGCLSLKYL